VAYTSPQNKAMVALFKTLPYKVKTTFDGDSLMLRCRFDELAEGPTTMKWLMRRASDWVACCLQICLEGVSPILWGCADRWSGPSPEEKRVPRKSRKKKF
jgi:hypothetical protein